MKYNFLLVLFSLFIFSSCFKGEIDKKEAYKNEELKVCKLDFSQFSDTEIWEEYELEPVKTNTDCGDCKVSGVVKYHKIDTDFAYVVYYGKGECDNEAHLVTYYADKKKEEKCLLMLACDSEN